MHFHGFLRLLHANCLHLSQQKSSHVKGTSSSWNGEHFIAVSIHFSTLQPNTATHGDNGVVIGEGLCRIDRSQVCCRGSSLSCNTAFLGQASVRSNTPPLWESRSLGYLRSLLMTGRWLLWSFRYSARNPSKDTRMRGGLEKLRKATTGRKSRKLINYLVLTCCTSVLGLYRPHWKHAGCLSLHHCYMCYITKQLKKTNCNTAL